MVWVFLILTLGSVTYAAYIVAEHFRESTLLGSRIQRNEVERSELETNVKVSEDERDIVKMKADQVEGEVRELETKENDLQTRIKDRKKELERRGKFRI